MPEPLFRKEALDRLQSPDEVDQVLRVLSRRDWLPLAVVGGLVLVAGIWSVVGRIAITVEGQAILVTPGKVVPFESPSPGQIAEWLVAPGDRVAKDQVLARLEQPELTIELKHARERLEEMRRKNVEMTRLDERAAQLQRADIQRRSEFTSRRIDILKAQVDTGRRLAEEILAKDTAYFTNQRERLDKAQKTIERLRGQLEERVRSYERLLNEGLVSQDTLLVARRSSIDSELQLAQIDQQAHDLELSEIRSQRSHSDAKAALDDQENEIASLRLQIDVLKTEIAHLDQTAFETAFARTAEESELSRTIQQLDEKLRSSGELKSTVAGTILELTASAGAVVTKGMRLGTIDMREDGDEMVALAYFAARDGKKVVPGSRARVSPETVERERYGSIVASVSSVSPYQVTAQGAEYLVGNGEVARALTADGRQIEVRAAIEMDPGNPDNESGLKWTSADGPPQSITAGTLSKISVVVEERMPITYVIPAIREWSRR